MPEAPPPNSAPNDRPNDPADEEEEDDGRDPVGQVRAAIDRPDPLYFQQASMLTLTFRFKGKRKLVASHLMETQDFVTELEAYLPVLAQSYPDQEVSAVEIVSYQKGDFFYDPWPGGLELVETWFETHRSEEEELHAAAAALEADGFDENGEPGGNDESSSAGA